MNKDILKNKPLKTWIKFSIVLILYILFCIWVGSPWLWPGVLLIIDGYITKKINWRWWKSSKNPKVVSAMKLLEDIVVVVFSVHVFFLFFFQNYQIPTSSLEKSYLVGDYLLVSKLSYGPRMPQTLISFPIIHNTFFWGGKSYLDKPQAEYRRLKGFGSVKRNDIVVFNFPAGDTVAVKEQNPDYYTLVNTYGRQYLRENKERFGEIIYRPVDKREHYVKRCIGLPGDSLEVRNNDVYINGERIKDPKNLQHTYYIQTDGRAIPEQLLDDLKISMDDRQVLLDGSAPQNFGFFQYLKLDTLSNGSYGLVHQLPLTQEMVKQIRAVSSVKNVVIEPSPSAEDDPTYPVDMKKSWTRDNYGPIWIPKKGATINLTLENLPLYIRCIHNFEGHVVAVKEGRIFIDGVVSDTYTFEMDYYFMMGDNRHRSADSRAWGFVPEDHIVGSPVWVWLSLDKDKGLFSGKIRWNRFLLPASKIE